MDGGAEFASAAAPTIEVLHSTLEQALLKRRFGKVGHVANVIRNGIVPPTLQTFALFADCYACMAAESAEKGDGTLAQRHAGTAEKFRFHAKKTSSGVAAPVKASKEEVVLKKEQVAAPEDGDEVVNLTVDDAPHAQGESGAGAGGSGALAASASAAQARAATAVKKEAVADDGGSAGTGSMAAEGAAVQPVEGVQVSDTGALEKALSPYVVYASASKIAGASLARVPVASTAAQPGGPVQVPVSVAKAHAPKVVSILNTERPAADCMARAEGSAACKSGAEGSADGRTGGPVQAGVRLAKTHSRKVVSVAGSESADDAAVIADTQTEGLSQPAMRVEKVHSPKVGSVSAAEKAGAGGASVGTANVDTQAKGCVQAGVGLAKTPSPKVVSVAASKIGGAAASSADVQMEGPLQPAVHAAKTHPPKVASVSLLGGAGAGGAASASVGLGTGDSEAEGSAQAGMPMEKTHCLNAVSVSAPRTAGAAGVATSAAVTVGSADVQTQTPVQPSLRLPKTRSPKVVPVPTAGSVVEKDHADLAKVASAAPPGNSLAKDCADQPIEGRSSPTGAAAEKQRLEQLKAAPALSASVAVESRPLPEGQRPRKRSRVTLSVIDGDVEVAAEKRGAGIAERMDIEDTVQEDGEQPSRFMKPEVPVLPAKNVGGRSATVDVHKVASSAEGVKTCALQNDGRHIEPRQEVSRDGDLTIKRERADHPGADMCVQTVLPIDPSNDAMPEKCTKPMQQEVSRDAPSSFIKTGRVDAAADEVTVDYVKELVDLVSDGEAVACRPGCSHLAVLLEYISAGSKPVFETCAHGGIECSVRIRLTQELRRAGVVDPFIRCRSQRTSSPNVRQEAARMVMDTLGKLAQKVAADAVKLLDRDLQWLKLNRWKIDVQQTNRNDAFKRAQAIILYDFYGGSVRAFGSHAAGLAQKHSDLDIEVVLPKPDAKMLATRNFICHNKRVLLYLSYRFVAARMSQVTVIQNARVPVLKYFDMDHQVRVDVTIASSTKSVLLTRLIRRHVSEDPRVWELAMLVKHWAYARFISRSIDHYICSVCWTVMVIYFLRQQSPIIGSFVEIRNKRSPHDSRDATFRRRPWKSCVQNDTSTLTTAELVTKFFEFYSNFDFARIAIQLGHQRVVRRSEMGNRHQVSAVVIEDPLEAGVNMAEGVQMYRLEHTLLELRRAHHISLHSGDVTKLCELPARELKEKD